MGGTRQECPNGCHGRGTCRCGGRWGGDSGHHHRRRGHWGAQSERKTQKQVQGQSVDEQPSAGDDVEPEDDVPDEQDMLDEQAEDMSENQVTEMAHDDVPVDADVNATWSHHDACWGAWLFLDL